MNINLLWKVRIYGHMGQLLMPLYRLAQIASYLQFSLCLNTKVFASTFSYNCSICLAKKFRQQHIKILSGRKLAIRRYIVDNHIDLNYGLQEFLLTCAESIVANKF